MPTVSDAISLKHLADEIWSEVEERAENIEPPQGQSREDVALAQVMLEYIEEVGITSEVQFCPHADTGGRRRCAISAYSLAEGSTRLDLFLTRSVEGRELQSLSSEEVGQLAGKVARFFEAAAKKEFDRLQDSPEALEAARRIHTERENLDGVRAFLLTNAMVRDRSVDGIDICGVTVNFEVVDIERLSRISRTATSRDDIVIDFNVLTGRPLSCLEMSPRAEEYDTFLAILPGELLYRLYDQYGQRLFEFNVRSFLQAKGKVNRGIRDTIHEDPDRFIAYNNGLVATADEIEAGMFYGEKTISRIVGLQIVNGAQTTASIHRAKKIDKYDISKVCVAVKITKVAPEKLAEFVPLISKYANTQNVIQVADLSANNEFHIELERLSEAEWCPGEESRWFYERARGAYQGAQAKDGATPARRREFKRITPPGQKISKTDLAKYLVAWMGRPHTVSSGAQKNFSVFMAELPELFPTEWRPTPEFYRDCIAKAIVYKACEKVARAEKFPAYRANIVTYLFALLAHVTKGELNLHLIWQQQGLSAELMALLTGWSRDIDKAIRESAGSKNVTEWCKKSDCWDAVKSRAFKLPRDLPPELQGQPKPEPAEASAESGDAQDQWDDEQNIELCLQLDAPAWAKINYWGLSTGRLDYYERGVAHTLSEYAASNWSRRPSVKQARIAVRAIQAAKHAGLLDDK